MIEAMYGVEFTSNLNNMGYGVVIFETGRIFGGDTSFVYIGRYEIQNGTIKATVKVNNDRMVMPSVLGDNLNEYTLHGEGVISRDEFTLEAYMEEHPEKKLTIKFTRRAELP
jgi:hypothetical protein